MDKETRNKWIKSGVAALFVVAFVVWGSFGWKMPEDKLEKTATIVKVAAQNVTYGYIIAHEAELVPEDVAEVVTVVSDSMKDACEMLTADKIEITELKSIVTEKVNKYIDEKFEGNVLYKTLVNGLLNTVFNSAEEYLNNKKADANDYLVIIKALEEGLNAGINDVARLK